MPADTGTNTCRSSHMRFARGRVSSSLRFSKLLTKAIGLLVALIVLVSCATLPADGDAVECDACKAMWIYLSSATPAPGLYRLESDGSKQPICKRCQEMAVRYFEQGSPPQRCADCGGRLRARGVDIVR